MKGLLRQTGTEIGRPALKRDSISLSSPTPFCLHWEERFLNFLLVFLNLKEIVLKILFLTRNGN